LKFGFNLGKNKIAQFKKKNNWDQIEKKQ